MTDLVLAIDQGTTNSKAMLVDRAGRIVAHAAAPVPIAFPKPGWVEQDGEAIWCSVLDAVAQCRAQAPGARLLALGLANQRESALVWDRRSGEPLGPCVTWQCRRSSHICDALRARGAGGRIEEKTGLALAPLFSASKAAWLLDNIPGARARAEAGEACFGTIDSWLLWRLTGGKLHATDASNASRTQLADLESGDWDRELLQLFNVPRAALPQIVPSCGVVGEAEGALSGVPIAGVAGDSHAAMFGHAAFHPGMVKATYGTGSSLMMLASDWRTPALGLSRTIAWRIGEATEYAIEGNIPSTGATMEWLSRILGKDNVDAVSKLAASVANSAGAYIVPAFAGLGAPYWDDQARGVISGLTRGAGPAHLARAAMESVAYQVRDVFEAMRAAAPAEALYADGGASRDDTLMQFQADLIGAPVLRNPSTDLAALGAAYLAGLAAGFWADKSEIVALARPLDVFEPRMDAGAAEQLYAGWRDAVARARLRPEARQ